MGRILINISLKNRRLTSTQLAAEFNETFDLDISPRSVRGRLNSAGLRGCKARKKPWLSQQNVKKRYEWAKKHENWIYEDWAKVVWSDETNIEVSYLGSISVL